MKVYFNYGREELMTEQEARKYLKEEILNDDYGVWEFIADNYYYEEIKSHLSQDFLEEITEELMTEQEARKCLKEEILNDDYDVWEFITDNYFYEEIMSHLSQDFLEEITEELINNQLENPDYFLVREFPD